MSSKAKASYEDVDNCIYLGCKATPNKFIAKLETPDGVQIKAWSDVRPTFKINSKCSVEHAVGSDVYNLYA